MFKIDQLSSDCWNITHESFHFKSIEDIQDYKFLRCVCYCGDEKTRRTYTLRPNYKIFELETLNKECMDLRVVKNLESLKDFQRIASSSKGVYVEWEVNQFVPTYYLWLIEFTGTVEDQALLLTLDNFRARFSASTSNAISFAYNASIFRDIVAQQCRPKP